MSHGWISLHRKFQEHDFWKEKRVFSKAEAWMDILMDANHSDASVMLGMSTINCNRGQSLNSVGTWANRWGWSPSKVRRFWKLLKELQMIETENVLNTTRLTVCNYDTYQNTRRTSDEPPVNPRRTSDEPPVTNNKNPNKANNGKNENNSSLEAQEGKKKNKRFKRPTPQQVSEYANSIDYAELDADMFMDHYDANGWKRGNTPIKDWKACVRTWKSKNKPADAKPKPTDWTDQKTRTLYSVQGRIPEEHRALFDADFADPEYRAKYVELKYPIPPEYVSSFNGNGKPSADLFDADERETV